MQSSPALLLTYDPPNVSTELNIKGGELCMEVYANNPGIQDMEAGESWIQGQPWLSQDIGTSSKKKKKKVATRRKTKMAWDTGQFENPV